jgi:aminoglycoside 6-adenylyltransferase
MKSEAGWTPMKITDEDQEIINRLIRWAEKQDQIRAMLLYSSRVHPHATVDRFSDYDVLLAVTDVRGFYENDQWLDDFGEVLVVFCNPVGLEYGFECSGFITHYQDGVKVDFGFYPLEFLSWAASQPKLPDDLDNGYIVLLDKDHLSEGLKPPTFTAFLPVPPTAKEYRAIINQFFNDAIYVAKNLWRDNLFLVKYCLDNFMKFHCLRQMLEWRVGIETGWSIKPGAHGKGLKHRVDSDTWTALERTYVGAGADENWEALFKTIDLFRKLALEVAESLAFEYPQDMDQRVVAYLEKIRQFFQPGPGNG